jgi:hypothetical protein
MAATGGVYLRQRLAVFSVALGTFTLVTNEFLPVVAAIASPAWPADTAACGLAGPGISDRRACWRGRSRRAAGGGRRRRAWGRTGTGGS